MVVLSRSIQLVHTMKTPPEAYRTPPTICTKSEHITPPEEKAHSYSYHLPPPLPMVISSAFSPLLSRQSFPSLSPVSYLLHIYAKILKPEVYEKFSNQSRAKNFQTTPISCKNFETSPIRKEDHFLMLISLSKNSKPVVFFIDKYPYVWYGIDKITRDNP